MIYKFKPFSLTKEIGKEYNSHIRLVPNKEDWILIMDYDAMILTTKTFEVIEKAIEKYPDTGVFGAMTNRIGYPYQRIEPLPDTNDEVKHHIAISERLANLYKDGECFEAHSIAGFFMLFKRELWDQNKFQDGIFDKEQTIFDRAFCNKAIRLGYKLRVIKGAYVWHTYRITKDFTDTEHLK